MAAGTAEGDALERLEGVLDRVLHPLLAAQELVVANEVARGPQRVGVLRGQLVGGEHQPNHLVVGGVAVERLDDPVAPVPDVRLAVADLWPVAGPVAVTPDVHPVPAPALAILR